MPSLAASGEHVAVDDRRRAGTRPRRCCSFQAWRTAIGATIGCSSAGLGFSRAEQRARAAATSPSTARPRASRDAAAPRRRAHGLALPAPPAPAPAARVDAERVELDLDQAPVVDLGVHRRPGLLVGGLGLVASCPGRAGCRRAGRPPAPANSSARRRASSCFSASSYCLASSSTPARRSRAIARYSSSAALSATQARLALAASAWPLSAATAAASRPRLLRVGGARKRSFMSAKMRARRARRRRPARRARARRTSRRPSTPWSRWYQFQPFQAAIGAERRAISSPGDEVAVLLPERLQLVELFLFFEVELGGHGVLSSGEPGIMQGESARC